ncbi:hypothetical protein Q7378_10485 [Glaesserella parasuis]|uniref:hypothetical protein n=1 Tax=Glaesserella parasuis TaxID=738 RepID=UPI001310399D|nr:hypothetical protein [Glaesserella parasuis]MDG6455661.1 hypothetical protein [Glaesserella parasuis]MDO9925101.1 hypothetical protein [Glaesserella parasuis]MDP0054870.1 hypothetical protein [Glaesserella parasuis]MDP0123004.1 hypothetical protein [Glaesserella parasuis]MDP0269431.1 hypothetical protein [Glaesserella parasuis]
MNNPYQLTGYTYNGKGELVKCGMYQAKAQADLAYQTLKAQYKTVEMVHIGGLNDE